MAASAMLERILGKPHLHKLRVIHLIEADCNPTLEASFGGQLMWHCEDSKALHDAQGSSCHGRSISNITLAQELVNNINTRSRTNHALSTSDVKACCGRMIATLTSVVD